MAADCETGEPRLDSETGEERECIVAGFPALVRSREARAIQVTVSTDAETGENEWNTVVNHDVPRSPGVFHIPPSLLHDNFSEARLLAHIICVLPVLILFPAFTVALCVFTELSVHCWYHKWERTHHKTGTATQQKIKPPHYCHITPLNVVVSAFCTHCQAKRILNNFGKQAGMRLRNKNLLAIHT